MVLEIRLSNFFSIKDEVVLDMQAASIQTKKAKELEENTFVCGNERLLKTVAIHIQCFTDKIIEIYVKPIS